MATQNADKDIASVSETWSELDSRTNDGLQVSLLWCADTSEVRVAVIDVHAGESFDFEVVAADALAAFHHPFAYAADHGRRSTAGTPVTTQTNPHTTGARHVTS